MSIRKGSARPLGTPLAADSLLRTFQKRSEFPMGVMVALTESCNLRCEHCFVVPPPDERQLSEQEIGRLLKDLAECGVLSLTLSGGEPALSPLLEQTVATASELSFSIRLKSNGTLFKPSQVEALYERGAAYLDVSLYHDVASMHDDFVGMQGAWRNTLRTATIFRELGGWVKVSMSLFHWNADRVEAMRELCQQLDVSLTVTTFLAPRLDGNTNNARHRLKTEQLEILQYDTALMDVEAYSRSQPEDPSRRPLCGAGTDGPFVSPNGDVRLCQMLPWVIGNVRTQRFRDIWLGSERRRWFADLRWLDLPKCAECEHSSVCSRCSAAVLHETGDVLGVAPYDCFRAKARFERLKRP